MKPRLPLAAADDTEAEFYEALAAGDLERLMAVWSDDEDAVCVHPGGPRVVGTAAIRDGFEAIFANGGIPVRPERVRRLAGPGCAVHSVLERIEVPGPQGPQTAWVVATNVYVETARGWRLVAHHASPGVPGEVQEIVEAASVLH